MTDPIDSPRPDEGDTGETAPIDIEAIETLLNERWGRSVFGWQVVRSGNPPYWHGYCGSDTKRRGVWLHEVEKPTLHEVFTELVALTGASGDDDVSTDREANPDPLLGAP